MIEKISWTKSAWSDYLYWQSQDKKTVKRINLLIENMMRTPFDGIGTPENLEDNLSGFMSRRIDETNRIVYAVDGNHITIISCRYHSLLEGVMAKGFPKMVRPDAKGRITLGPILEDVSSVRVSVKDNGQIVLDLFREVPAREAWLYENGDALEKVRTGLMEAAEGMLADYGSFSEYLGEE